jgi:hypothetical protein
MNLGVEALMVNGHSAVEVLLLDFTMKLFLLVTR